METAAAEHATALLLRDGVIILGVAMVFVTLFRRLGLGAVLGYLVAGALVGQQGLGLIDGSPDTLLRLPSSASSCFSSWSGSSFIPIVCGG
jgi:NhaP-type Na+/H+ and K+/H+ antiporter